MIGFIFFTFALLVIVTWLIAPALLKKMRPMSDTSKQTNIAIARERLADLELQLKQGDIGQEQYDQAHDEIELALLDDANTEEKDTRELPVNYQLGIFVLLTIIPFLSFGLYVLWGTPKAISANAAVTAQVENPHSNNPQATGQGNITPGKGQHTGSLTEMIAKLEAKLASQPNNPDGWYMLAKSYMYLKQYAKAETAYRKLLAQVGDHADVLLGLSDAIAMSHNGDMQGEPFELAKRALELEPENKTALWLTGMGYHYNGDYPAAISLWKKLLPKLSDDPQSTQEVKALIDNAQQQLGITDTASSTASPPTAAIPLASKPAASEQAAAKLTVTVKLGPELENQAAKTDFVMVYAQRVTGMKMPLAMYRAQVKDLPMTITLSDALALSPMNKLSDQQTVNVIARLSRSGQAMKQAGDIEVVSGPHAVTGSAPFTITLQQ